MKRVRYPRILLQRVSDKNMAFLEADEARANEFPDVRVVERGGFWTVDAYNDIEVYLRRVRKTGKIPWSR